ncbi:MAG: hypothetical protein HWE27_18650 [Gammaproteobacteria bacterium]|nr:hypothetical protein [Gammaproteobacteria bacterium]
MFYYEVDFDLKEFQITLIEVSHETSTTSVTLVHESGDDTKKIQFDGVRRVVIEYPPFSVDSPYLIAHFLSEKLSGDGKEFLEEVRYGHKDRFGNVASFDKDRGELYRLRLSGDINLDIVYEHFRYR